MQFVMYARKPAPCSASQDSDLGARRCRDDPEVFGPEPRDREVVDHPAVLVAHRRVQHLPVGCEPGHIARHHPIQDRGGVGPFQVERALAVDVVDRDAPAGGQVLLFGGGEHERAFEADALDHLGAEGDELVVIGGMSDGHGVRRGRRRTRCPRDRPRSARRSRRAPVARTARCPRASGSARAPTRDP